MEKIENILQKYDYNGSSIIQILGDVQREYNYLSRENLDYISQRLKKPLSIIYSIATFYSNFSLKPKGKHIVTVCMGTACHVRGATNVLNRIEDRLAIPAGSTTEDNRFTLETVNCLGACALAPIVVVDRKYNGQVTVQKVDTILNEYQGKKTVKESKNKK